MDLMLAAEFRGAMCRVFRVDILFAAVLNRRTSVRSLAEVLCHHFVLAAGRNEEKRSGKGKEVK